MDALQTQALKNVVEQMGLRTQGYVLLEVRNGGEVNYTMIGDDAMIAYMHAALGAYLSAKLKPAFPVEIVPKGLSVVSPPDPGAPKPV